MINSSISVIIPIYNEKELVDDSVVKVYNFLRKEFHDFEILIIESGSDDGTDKICDTLCAKYEEIKVFHEGSRKGLGSALKLGFKNATKDYVMRIVVDLPFSFETILMAFNQIPQYDVIFSYRDNDTRSWFRRIQSSLFNFIINSSLGLKIKHVNCIPKIYKREIIQNLELIIDGWFIDAEIVYRIEHSNNKYLELPVELIDRQLGESKVSIFTPLHMLKELYAFKKALKAEVSKA